MDAAESLTRRAASDAVALQPNNFDLLRLLAAAQVVFGHVHRYFFADHHAFWIALILQAPGVPIFFFISGFLISASWERNPRLGPFAQNRFLRIYPAYVLTAVVSLTAILAFAHVAGHGETLAGWFAMQLALLPQWNPAFLRSYGSGVVNGALWTIPIEVCFYIATPILHRLAPGGRRKDVLLCAVALFSLAFMMVMVSTGARGSKDMAVKGIGLTPIPWIWMYICGWLAQRHRHRLLPLVQGRVLLLALLNLVLMAACVQWRSLPLLFSGSRFISPINFALLALLILAIAFSARDLSSRLLRRNDISYGVYLFHIPIANMLLANGILGAAGAIATAALTPLMAAFSWFALEKPILSWRREPLYRHDASIPAAREE